MVPIKYNLVSFGENGDASLTAFINGEMFTATNSHPNWDAIVAKVHANDESVAALFDISNEASKRFERLSERVAVANGRIYFDGEEVDNALTQQVARFIEADEDFVPLVSFFEKVMTNPQVHSRDQLFSWLKNRDFTITADGNLIGYKGVKVENDEYFSISRGKAVSNGIEYSGAIPNPLGAVVEMPRSEVQHDPSVGCHTGLHAGTWDYAHNFAQGAVLKVEINPRDVVSVPTDCDAQKLRVCRYTVLEVIDAPETALVTNKPVDEYDDLGYDDEYDDENYDGMGYGSYDYGDDDEEDGAEETPKSDTLTISEPYARLIQDLSKSEVVDTRTNHTRQQRDEFGRFIPKGK